jgi:hypothetical protein
MENLESSEELAGINCHCGTIGGPIFESRCPRCPTRVSISGVLSQDNISTIYKLLIQSWLFPTI